MAAVIVSLSSLAVILRFSCRWLHDFSRKCSDFSSFSRHLSIYDDLHATIYNALGK